VLDFFVCRQVNHLGIYYNLQQVNSHTQQYGLGLRLRIGLNLGLGLGLALALVTF